MIPAIVGRTEKNHARPLIAFRLFPSPFWLFGHVDWDLGKERTEEARSCLSWELELHRPKDSRVSCSFFFSFLSGDPRESENFARLFGWEQCRGRSADMVELWKKKDDRSRVSRFGSRGCDSTEPISGKSTGGCRLVEELFLLGVVV